MDWFFDRGGVLRLSAFERWPWLAYGFSSRRTGDMRVAEPREGFVRAAAGAPWPLATLRQIHSGIVHIAHRPETGRRAGDALLTAEGRMLVGVRTADCLPVLVVDARRRAVGAVHAGWRGLARRVVEKAAGEMRRQFGADPADLHAAIGPGIQACCFEVGAEVLEEFACQFVEAEHFCRPDPPNPAHILLPRQTLTGGGHALMRKLDSGRGRINLAEACRRQLLAAGLHPAHIYDSGLCTACDGRRFYSYRREKEAAGRMLAVVGVRPGR